jgi:hypothetical protein
MDRKTFRSACVCNVYNCHSADKRAQFSISEGGMRRLDGKVANNVIMQRASSISLSASMKVGYLYGNVSKRANCKNYLLVPFLYDMIQSIGWLMIF